MYRSYRYRIEPTKSQEATLASWLTLGCELYNAALEERRDAWRKQRVGIGLFSQMSDIPDIRKCRDEFTRIPVKVMRGWLRRLDRSFASFFSRLATGARGGFPRFKSRSRFDTVEIDDLGGCKLIVSGGNRIHIPMLGKVKLKQHRPTLGTPKSMRVVRDGSRWTVVIQCADVPSNPLSPAGHDVGIDLGINVLAMASDGEPFKNPHALRAAQLELARAQRRVSRRKRGSHRRRKAVRILARKHQRVANVRRENAIGIARSLVAKYDTIYVEDLNINRLARSMFAKSVHDASWGTLLHWIRVKAEEAGREVIAVDPRGTSQECSECDAEVRKDLSVRIHNCPHCGLVLDRDVNAARNIKARGRRVRGGSAGSQPPMIREESPTQVIHCPRNRASPSSPHAKCSMASAMTLK